MLLVFDGPTYPVAGKPISVTTQIKHMRRNKIDEIPIPRSALEILLVNHQVHNEAHSIFYKQNSLVFSRPIDLHSFALSLGHQRLDSVRELTCFYEEVFASAQSKTKANNTMKLTLGLIHRLKILRKLHLCLRHRRINFVGFILLSNQRLDQIDPETLPGVDTLFTLRNIPDIKVRDLDLEDCSKNCKRDFQGAWLEATGIAVDNLPMTWKEREQRVREELDKSRAALKHFNHGLQLAQNGVDMRSYRFRQKGRHADSWPPVPETPCGPDGVCSCGDGEEEQGNEEGENCD